MQATTRAALLRGTDSTDSFGDPVDDNSTPLKVYSEWVEQRRNLATNPRMGNGTATYGARGTGTTVAAEGEALRVTTPGTATREGLNYAPAGPTTAGARYSFSADVVAPPATRMLVRMSNNVNAVGESPYTADGTVQRVGISVLSAGAGISSDVNTSAVSPAQASSFLVDNVLYEMANPGGVYFDGSTTPNGELERTRWLGVANASASVLETRTLLEDYSDFPISLTERSKRVQDPSSGMWKTVRYMVARVPWRVGAIIDDGDRIRDNRTGLVYQLDEMTRTPRSISGRSSVTLNLIRAGA